MRHHNVISRITDYIGQCEDAGPVIKINLSPEDVMRDVIYIPAAGHAEHGRISSWGVNNETVFVRYHKGDTAAATHVGDLRFVKAPPAPYGIED
jgi:hypothetical protein